MRPLPMFLLLSACVISAAAEETEPTVLWVEAQALFYDFRDLESRSHIDRIRILERAEACIQQAHDRQSFHRCEQDERAGRQQLRVELSKERRRLRDQRADLLDRF